MTSTYPLPYGSAKPKLLPPCPHQPPGISGVLRRGSEVWRSKVGLIQPSWGNEVELIQPVQRFALHCTLALLDFAHASCMPPTSTQSAWPGRFDATRGLFLPTLVIHQSVLHVFLQQPGMVPLVLRRGMVECHASAAMELSELGAMPAMEVAPLSVGAGVQRLMHLPLRSMHFLLGPMSAVSTVELGPWALRSRAMLEAASMVELVFLPELMQMASTATLATMTFDVVHGHPESG